MDQKWLEGNSSHSYTHGCIKSPAFCNAQWPRCMEITHFSCSTEWQRKLHVRISVDVTFLHLMQVCLICRCQVNTDPMRSQASQYAEIFWCKFYPKTCKTHESLLNFPHNWTHDWAIERLLFSPSASIRMQFSHAGNLWDFIAFPSTYH